MDSQKDTDTHRGVLVQTAASIWSDRVTGTVGGGRRHNHPTNKHTIIMCGGVCWVFLFMHTCVVLYAPIYIYAMWMPL